MRDLDEEDPVDVAAREQGLSFIRLDGTIGCMVNGAGLAMTTMDLIKRAGGEPANFLDIGGGAKADKVAAAMRLILADQNVRAILVNIFGGIARGDEVAHGLVEARREQERHVPMVVRIVGTNADEAARILAEAGDPDIADRVQPRRGGREGVVAARPASRAGGRMSILVDADTRLLVQGITGREGMFHAQQMQDYGTNVVAGMTPGKGGQTALDQARAGVRHVPRRRRADRRQHERHLRPGRRRAGRDPRGRRRRHQDRSSASPSTSRRSTCSRSCRSSTQAGARLVGPNCPGATSVGKAKVGIIPGNIHQPGHVGLVSRSGTLTYEVVEALTEAGIGQSTCVGIGGDPINGSNFIDILTPLPRRPRDRGASC